MIFIIVFLAGLIIGSFLNCIIFRIEKEESFLKGRSKCMHCGHELNWKDLVPIFSFLSLAGKCRYCKKQISFQYPLVEICTGILFVLIFWFLKFDLLLGFDFLDLLKIVYFWTIASFFIIIFVYDLKYYLIPDSIVYSSIVVVLFYRVLEFFNFGHWNLGVGTQQSLWSILLAICLGAGIFLFIFLISRGKWIGFGDVKLGLLMGLFLGFPNIIIGLFSGVFIGAIIGLTAMLFGKKKFSSEIPFGPFLITGTFIALFWGNQIISWYLNLII